MLILVDYTVLPPPNLRIRWAVHNAKAQKTTEEGVINSVYVRFITPRVSEYVTEEAFHQVFDAFGSVLDVSIKESSIDQVTILYYCF